MEESSRNWSEAVEDLVSSGDTSSAISLLESVISKEETERYSLQLSSALTSLANIYNSQGFSLKADELLSRATLAKQRAHSQRDVEFGSQNNLVDARSSKGHYGEPEKRHDSKPSNESSDDDDWEALADRAPDEFLASEAIPAVASLTIDEPKSQIKRRGRGTFSYQRGELYSDRVSDETTTEDVSGDDASLSQEQNTEKTILNYGTQHVLVLADFLPSIRTTDLEKYFEDFRECGFVIRWVNDTCALAVFKTPSVALEAFNGNRCPFTVRVLGEDDAMLNSLKVRDLEPPRQRPQTSTRTAERLIAQGMGLKLPSSTFGSREYRRQEEARRNRIVTRQKLRNDAWGDDVN